MHTPLLHVPYSQAESGPVAVKHSTTPTTGTQALDWQYKQVLLGCASPSVQVALEDASALEAGSEEVGADDVGSEEAAADETGSEEAAAELVQALVVPGWQEPPEHTSPLVQASPSSQAAVLFGYSQPEAGLQELSVQALPSSQATDVPPVQEPPLQTSPLVHASPSSQESVFGLDIQPTIGLQISVVHTLPSSQLMLVPVHVAPPEQ